MLRYQMQNIQGQLTKDPLYQHLLPTVYQQHTQILKSKLRLKKQTRRTQVQGQSRHRRPLQEYP